MIPADFINLIASGAQDSNRMSGIPASVSIAQAALESAWGGSTLAAQGKNLFGIKATSEWDGPTMQLPTHEVVDGQVETVLANWRVYKDWGGSILDHAQFFFANPRYAPALEAVEDPVAFASAIQQCGYSTDPAYAQKVMEIVRIHNLTQYDIPKAEWSLIEWAIYG